jgi:glutathione synthase
VVVAKRANSAGGRGVFKVWRQGENWWSDNITEGERPHGSLAALMAHLSGKESQALQLSHVLPRTLEGDKPVVVVDGEIHGGYLRRSIGGHWVNNVSHDGICSPAAVRDGEREAIRATGPRCRDLELRTLGSDFLRDDNGRWMISEINAGNVGGFHRLGRTGGQPVMQRYH